jgi:hypothetical protein
MLSCLPLRRFSSMVILCASLFAGVSVQASSVLLPGAKPSNQQRLSVWGFDVYDARVWILPGFSIPKYSEHSFVLELSYLRSLEGSAIAKRSVDEMRKVGSFTREQESSWLKAMLEIFPNVQKGDRLQGLYVPNVGAEFLLNDKLLGRIQDPMFAQLFFGIWMHESTSAPAIRQAWMKAL